MCSYNAKSEYLSCLELGKTISDHQCGDLQAWARSKRHSLKALDNAQAEEHAIRCWRSIVLMGLTASRFRMSGSAGRFRGFYAFCVQTQRVVQQEVHFPRGSTEGLVLLFIASQDGEIAYSGRLKVHVST